jgi:hypothetical protein
MACTFANPCLGHEPKARVATLSLLESQWWLEVSFGAFEVLFFFEA